MNRERLRASAVCHHEGHLLVVRLRDPVSGIEALYPPGGAIDPGETPAEAARRETLEETGLRVRVDAGVELVVTYPFRWADTNYAVTTHYMVAAIEDAFERHIPSVIDAEYNLGASWTPLAEALTEMPPVIANAVARVLHRAQRADWEGHVNIAGLASTLLMIHDQFRAASERLVRRMEEHLVEPSRIANAFVPLAQTLHHHHHAEEAMLFPLVQRRMGVAPARLVTDHEALTDAIEAVERCLVAGTEATATKASIASFHDILIAHLDREESLVIPILLEMTATEARALLNGG